MKPPLGKTPRSVLLAHGPYCTRCGCLLPVTPCGCDMQLAMDANYRIALPQPALAVDLFTELETMANSSCQQRLLGPSLRLDLLHVTSYPIDWITLCMRILDASSINALILINLMNRECIIHMRNYKTWRECPMNSLDMIRDEESSIGIVFGHCHQIWSITINVAKRASILQQAFLRTITQSISITGYAAYDDNVPGCIATGDAEPFPPDYEEPIANATDTAPDKAVAVRCE